MEDRAKKVEATAAALQSRVDSEVKRNSGLARIVKVLQDQLATEQTARQDLVKNHDSMQEKVSDLGKMLQKSKEETEKLEKKLAEKERSESALVAEKTAVESGKRQIEQKLLEAEREILKLKEDKTSWASRRISMETELIENEKKIQNLQFKLQAVKKHHDSEAGDVALAIQALKRVGDTVQRLSEKHNAFQFPDEFHN